MFLLDFFGRAEGLTNPKIIKNSLLHVNLSLLLQNSCLESQNALDYSYCFLTKISTFQLANTFYWDTIQYAIQNNVDPLYWYRDTRCAATHSGTAYLGRL